MRIFNFFISHWPKVFSIFLFVLLFGAYVNSFAVFTPGQTLDPNCAPGAVGCIVTSVYPDSGIPNSTGSAWGTSYSTSGSGTTLALATSPVFVTPTLGVATATSINGLIFTSLANGFTVAGGTTSKTLTINNTLSLTGTDGSTLNIGTGGTLGTNAYTSTAYIPYTGGASNVDLGIHNLTVDTNSLFVNSSSHRVGIGTISPSYKLEISGSSATDGIRTTGGVDFNQVPNPTTAPSMALILAAGNVNAGTHYYAVTYVSAVGETSMNHNGTPVTTDGTHGQVTVTIPVSPDSRVTSRKIYRTKAGGNWWDGYYLATVADNTTTDYIDNIADASITVYAGEDRANTTNNQLTVNGTKSMLVDSKATWLGYNAGASITSAGYSVLVGQSAGQYLTSGNLATFVGALAGRNTTTGSSNTFIGEESAYRNTTGYDNSYLGYASGFNNVTGNGNTAVGAQSLAGTSTQSAVGNTAIGAYSLFKNYGNYNTALGNNAGANNLTGTTNVFIGASAGYYETGSNKLFIDTYARASEADARTKALIYGIFDSSVANQKLVVNGNLGVGAASPGYTLQAGNSGVTGIVARFENSTGTCDINPTTTALVCSSDINLKKNVLTIKEEKEFILQTIPGITGESIYNKFMNLTPVKYNWKTEEDSTTKHVGLIAQEVEQIFPDLVFTDSATGFKSVALTNLIPYTIEVVQEMGLKIKDLSSLDTSSVSSLGSLIKNFLANAENTIEVVFFGEVHTKKLCLDDLCVTKEELRQMLDHSNIGTTDPIITIPAGEVAEAPVTDSPISEITEGLSSTTIPPSEDIIPEPVTSSSSGTSSDSSASTTTSSTSSPLDSSVSPSEQTVSE